MNKYEIAKRIEGFAPLETQESWDASGWIVDLAESEVHKVMFALTITDEVFEQARRNECDMIISHHPLFFVAPSGRVGSALPGLPDLSFYLPEPRLAKLLNWQPQGQGLPHKAPRREREACCILPASVSHRFSGSPVNSC